FQAPGGRGGRRFAPEARIGPRRRRVGARRCAGHHLFGRAVGVGRARAPSSAHAPHRETVFAGVARRDARRDARGNGLTESPFLTPTTPARSRSASWCSACFVSG